MLVLQLAQSASKFAIADSSTIGKPRCEGRQECRPLGWRQRLGGVEDGELLVVGEARGHGED